MAFPTKPRSQYNVYVVWSCLPIGWLEEFGQVSQRVSKDFVKVESLKRRLKLQSILFPQEKREGVAMDLRFGPEQDIMSDIGYANMIYQILNLKQGAAMWAAPVCSTWIFLFFGHI